MSELTVPDLLDYSPINRGNLSRIMLLDNYFRLNNGFCNPIYVQLDISSLVASEDPSSESPMHYVDCAIFLELLQLVVASHAFKCDNKGAHISQSR